MCVAGFASFAAIPTVRTLPCVPAASAVPATVGTITAAKQVIVTHVLVAATARVRCTHVGRSLCAFAALPRLTRRLELAFVLRFV